MRDWRPWLWYETCYWMPRTGLTWAFGLRFEGRENIPRQGPALLIGNHQSFLDPLATGVAAPRHTCFLARKSLFRHRLFGGLIHILNAVPGELHGIAETWPVAERVLVAVASGPTATRLVRQHRGLPLGPDLPASATATVAHPTAVPVEDQRRGVGQVAGVDAQLLDHVVGPQDLALPGGRVARRGARLPMVAAGVGLAVGGVLLLSWVGHVGFVFFFYCAVRTLSTPTHGRSPPTVAAAAGFPAVAARRSETRPTCSGVH